MRHKTRRTWNEPGHAHELTFSCYQRYKFLTVDRTRRWLVDALQLARTIHAIQLWAYVIMPQHAHILLWPTAEDVDVGALRKTIKQSVSRRALAHLRRRAPHWLDRLRVRRSDGRIEHRFWQAGGGYDRNLWREDAVWTAIEYIHANPVRRGLCALPTDWVWSSARWYAQLSDVALSMDGPPPVPTPTQWQRKPRE